MATAILAHVVPTHAIRLESRSNLRLLREANGFNSRRIHHHEDKIRAGKFWQGWREPGRVSMNPSYLCDSYARLDVQQGQSESCVTDGTATFLTCKAAPALFGVEERQRE